MNDLQHSEPAAELRTLVAELTRSYILAGRQDSLPPLQQLSETAGAILSQNAREARPVPSWLWGDLFQFTRRKWSLCGFGELMKAWEGDEFREWQADRRRRAESSKPKPPAPPPAEPFDFAEVWEAQWKAGDWVPACAVAECERRFGQRKNLCENPCQ